jgi:predicted negative regulator of RcsB-dependent stress response
MAALDLQEQEQVEEFKAWWKENRNHLIGAVLIVVAVMGGWRGWQYYQYSQSSQAATLYDGFLKQLASNDPTRVNDAAAAVMEKFGGTGYAPRAALQAATLNLQKNDAEHAKTQLRWVVEHADEVELRDVARLRLASRYLDEAKYADAMQLLDAKHPASFDGLYADLRGDVLNAQGKKDEARSSYKLAYEKTSEGSVYRNLIQMKMDALVSSK